MVLLPARCEISRDCAESIFALHIRIADAMVKNNFFMISELSITWILNIILS